MKPRFNLSTLKLFIFLGIAVLSFPWLASGSDFGRLKLDTSVWSPGCYGETDQTAYNKGGRMQYLPSTHGITKNGKSASPDGFGSVAVHPDRYRHWKGCTMVFPNGQKFKVASLHSGRHGIDRIDIALKNPGGQESAAFCNSLPKMKKIGTLEVNKRRAYGDKTQQGFKITDCDKANIEKGYAPDTEQLQRKPAAKAAQKKRKARKK